MPTDNLDLTQIAAEQAENLDASINLQSAQLDAAVTAPLLVTINATSPANAGTVTKAELQAANVIEVIPDGGDAPDGPILLTLATAMQRGTFTLVNDTLQSVTFEVTAQPDTAPVTGPGTSAVLQCDGASVRLVGRGDLASLNLGTAGVGVEALEFGDGYTRVTRLIVNGVLPDIAGGAAESEGLLVYTFPAGVIEYDVTRMNISITQTEGFINADQPEVGIGSTLAASASATLGATEDDYVAGLGAADCTGTKTDKSESTATLIETGDSHAIHFNAADTWAASGDAAAIVSGDIWLAWRFLGD